MADEVIGLGRATPMKKAEDAPAPFPVRPVVMAASVAPAANPAGAPAYDLPSAERAHHVGEIASGVRSTAEILKSRIEVLETELAQMTADRDHWMARARSLERPAVTFEELPPPPDACVESPKRKGWPAGKKRGPRAVAKTTNS